MVTRAQVVAEARTWLGTPYVHQGRVKGEAADCAGVILGVAHALGLTDFEHLAYDRVPDGSLLSVCEAQMTRILPAHARGGDVLVFKFEHWPTHLAFLTEPGVVLHAYMPRRRVVEHRMERAMLVVAAFRLPGVED